MKQSNLKTRKLYSNSDLLIKLTILIAIHIGLYAVGCWETYFIVAPLIALVLIIKGTLLIAFSVFPSGERSTSPGSQTINGTEIFFTMIDSFKFYQGIHWLVLGYFTQIIIEIMKILRLQ